MSKEIIKHEIRERPDPMFGDPLYTFFNQGYNFAKSEMAAGTQNTDSAQVNLQYNDATILFDKGYNLARTEMYPFGANLQLQYNPASTFFNQGYHFAKSEMAAKTLAKLEMNTADNQTQQRSRQRKRWASETPEAMTVRRHSDTKMHQRQ